MNSTVSETIVGHLTIREWSAARRSYSYPPARLTEQANGPLVVMGRAVGVDISLLKAGDCVTLDSFHHGLLTSEHKTDRLHGFLSVVFWGFYGSAIEGRHTTAGRALSRAKWFLNGNRSFKATNLDKLDMSLCLAAGLVQRGRFSDALRELMSIRFLKMAFATKVIAFMSPQTAGVYDRRIAERLAVLGSTIPAFSKMHTNATGPFSHSKAAAYDCWCLYCNTTASELTQMTSEHWRAIDVERALFATARA